MKINPFGNLFRIDSSPRSKRSEGEGGHARQQYEQQQGGKNQGGDREPPRPVDPTELRARIDEALTDFKADAATRSSGLSATLEGSGPGLRIAVKDSHGTVLRQFTGDEFLRLRQGTAKDTRARGKILDQKV